MGRAATTRLRVRRGDGRGRRRGRLGWRRLGRRGDGRASGPGAGLHAEIIAVATPHASTRRMLMSLLDQGVPDVLEVDLRLRRGRRRRGELLREPVEGNDDEEVEPCGFEKESDDGVDEVADVDGPDLEPEKSGVPPISPISGVMRSLTSESTIAPKAAPMMTRTARSSTLPRAMKSRNPFSIDPSSGKNLGLQASCSSTSTCPVRRRRTIEKTDPVESTAAIPIRTR